VEKEWRLSKLVAYVDDEPAQFLIRNRFLISNSLPTNRVAIRVDHVGSEPRGVDSSIIRVIGKVAGKGKLDLRTIFLRKGLSVYPDSKRVSYFAQEGPASHAP